MKKTITKANIQLIETSDNKEALELWAEVDKRMIGSPEMDDMDVLKVVSGLKHFLKDMDDRFDLSEFAE